MAVAPETEERPTLLRFDLLSDVSHAVTTRHGGVSHAPYATLNLSFAGEDRAEHVVLNRERVAGAMGLDLARIAAGRLTHGTGVTVVSRGQGENLTSIPVRPSSERMQPVFQSDAVVSDLPGWHFLVTSADCTPLLFASRDGTAVGLAHAGWRGTAGGIAGNTVASFRTAFDVPPQALRVVIGPSIGPCCYRVGQDVPERFRVEGREGVVLDRPDGTYLDLWASNRRQLLDLGVPAESIAVVGLCTSCRTDLFFSHRAERGRTGRFAALIGRP